MTLRIAIVGEAFNFSNQLQISVLELVHRILALMNKSYLEPVILNESRNEIKHQYLSTEKAQKLLKWKPISTLDRGLSETIKWYQNFVDHKLALTGII
jgi:CDP-glucose 4,6-dehydratase